MLYGRRGAPSPVAKVASGGGAAWSSRAPDGSPGDLLQSSNFFCGIQVLSWTPERAPPMSPMP